MLDTGQMFWFTPDFRSKQKSSQDGAAQETATKKKPPLVLVVDDEQLVADTTAEVLRRNGFRGIAAYGGKQALDLVERLRPDYVLSDVLMPLMNGVELALAIAKLNQATKILLFSGQAGTSVILEQAAAEGHYFDLVAKPIHPDKLIQALREKK
jgi:CheY-like chemotaxis protein